MRAVIRAMVDFGSRLVLSGCPARKSKKTWLLRLLGAFRLTPMHQSLILWLWNAQENQLVEVWMMKTPLAIALEAVCRLANLEPERSARILAATIVVRRTVPYIL